MTLQKGYKLYTFTGMTERFDTVEEAVVSYNKLTGENGYVALGIERDLPNDTYGKACDLIFKDSTTNGGSRVSKDILSFELGKDEYITKEITTALKEALNL